MHMAGFDSEADAMSNALEQAPATGAADIPVARSAAELSPAHVAHVDPNLYCVLRLIPTSDGPLVVVNGRVVASCRRTADALEALATAAQWIALQEVAQAHGS